MLLYKSSLDNIHIRYFEKKRKKKYTATLSCCVNMCDIDSKTLLEYKNVFESFNQLIQNCAKQKLILEEMVNRACMECFSIN